MIGAGLDEYTWRSQAVLAAELSADGTIVRANPALEALCARDPVGMPFDALLSEPQREAFRRCLASADAWVDRTFAFAGDPARPATDRTLWLRRAGAGATSPARRPRPPPSTSAISRRSPAPGWRTCAWTRCSRTS